MKRTRERKEKNTYGTLYFWFDCRFQSLSLNSIVYIENVYFASWPVNVTFGFQCLLGGRWYDKQDDRSNKTKIVYLTVEIEIDYCVFFSFIWNDCFFQYKLLNTHRCRAKNVKVIVDRKNPHHQKKYYPIIINDKCYSC